MRPLTLIIVIMILSNVVWAGEVTGVGRQVETILKKAQLSKLKLKEMGLKLKMGEVTGAGKIHVDDIALLVMKNKVVNFKSVDYIEFSHPSQAKFVSEVDSFSIDGKPFTRSKILAYIIQK